MITATGVHYAVSMFFTFIMQIIHEKTFILYECATCSELLCLDPIFLRNDYGLPIKTRQLSLHTLSLTYTVSLLLGHIVYL